MKIISKIIDLNKAVNRISDLGFVPTMGGLHKGHISLIKISKKKCKKTLVSIFVNPTQFDNKKDFASYPRKLNKDLKILKKLNVDYIFLPHVKEIYNKKRLNKIKLNKSQKILCAKFRKGHFEGVLDVMERFVKLLSPNYIFMGEKDFQQLFLVKNFIESKFKSKIYSCKTIRNKNNVALSSRHCLLKRNDLIKAGFIANNLIKFKSQIMKNKNNINSLLKKKKNFLIKQFKIKIEYLEIRNIIDLKKTIINKKYKIFIAYYINKVRLIDNF